MFEYIILEDFNIDKYTYNENNGSWQEWLLFTGQECAARAFRKNIPFGDT